MGRMQVDHGPSSADYAEVSEGGYVMQKCGSIIGIVEALFVLSWLLQKGSIVKEGRRRSTQQISLNALFEFNYLGCLQLSIYLQLSAPNQVLWQGPLMVATLLQPVHSAEKDNLSSLA